MQTVTIMGKEYLDLTAAAQELAVKKDTIRRYIKENRLKAAKSGGRWYIEPAELAKLAPAPGAGLAMAQGA